MKKIKKYWRGLVFAVAVFIVLFLQTGNTVAADLEQSPDEVSKEIVHEHDDEACSTQVWIPCGGTWIDDHHGSHRIHYCSNQKSEEIVNGHSLSEIHWGDWYWGYSTEEDHDGEYVTEFNCDLSTIGSFAIKRTEDDEGIHLTAYTRVTDADLGDYTIRWDDGTTGAVNSSVTIDVDSRRTYTATLNWHDVKRNADFTDSLSYTDISFPCRCEFVSDGDVAEEMEIRCGEKPESAEIPEKTGYIFEGYYKDDVQWIDQDGSPTEDFNITQSDYEISLSAEWTAKSYEIMIGDEIFTFIYDEPYDDIDIEKTGLIKQGYEFGGVSIDGELIFNEDGTAAGDGIWKWDMPEDAETEILWEEVPVKTDDETDDKDESDHHRHHDKTEDKETEPEEQEQETAVIRTVSDDQCKIAVSSDEAEINEVLQEDNDHSDETDPDELSVESNGEDSPAGDDGPATVEPADMERPYTELFYAETDGIPEQESINADEDELLPDEGEGTGEKESPSVWIKRVMVVTAVTCGVIGGGTAAVYAVYAGFVYLFGMASVINVLPDGRKKNLGKLTVADRNGGDIEISIPQNFVDNCSTGNIEIVLPEIFVKKKDRKQLVVIVNEKKYLKNIKKNVDLKLFA